MVPDNTPKAKQLQSGLSGRICFALTFEQNRLSQEALMAAVWPWVGCLGPWEASIFWAACSTTLYRSYRGPILSKLMEIWLWSKTDPPRGLWWQLFGLGWVVWDHEKLGFFGQLSCGRFWLGALLYFTLLVQKYIVLNCVNFVKHFPNNFSLDSSQIAIFNSLGFLVFACRSS